MAKMPWQKPLHELIHGLDVSLPEVSADGLHGKDYFNAGCLSQIRSIICEVTSSL